MTEMEVDKLLYDLFFKADPLSTRALKLIKELLEQMKRMERSDVNAQLLLALLTKKNGGTITIPDGELSRLRFQAIELHWDRDESIPGWKITVA